MGAGFERSRNWCHGERWIVTLTGTVDSYRKKSEAEDAARMLQA